MSNFLRVLVLVWTVFGVQAANPNYSYHVKIADPAEANFQEKAETRLGDKAQGFYSVVEPNGALRTVNYIADENGFQPTVTYTYGHPVPQVKKVLAAPFVGATTIVKQPLIHSVPAASYQQVFSAAPAVGAYSTFTGSPHQYAASYGTPVFSVKEARSFIKAPLVAQQAAAILAAGPSVQGGYGYPVPEQKLEYPVPAPAPAPVVAQEGYDYPVPQVQLAYPKVETVLKAVAPPTVIKASPPAQVQPFFEFGARLPPQPQYIAHQAQLLAPQPQYAVQAPIFQQAQFPAQPHYAHSPAQVYHQQVHHVVNPQPPAFHYAPRHVAYGPPQQFIQAQPLAVAQAPQFVQKYEDIVVQHQGLMRYAEAPVATYLPPSPPKVAPTYLPPQEPQPEYLPAPQVQPTYLPPAQPQPEYLPAPQPQPQPEYLPPPQQPLVQKVHLAQPQQLVQKVHVAQPQQFVQKVHLPPQQQFIQKVQYAQPQQFVQQVHYAQPQQFVQKVHVAQPQQFVQKVHYAQPQQFVQKVHVAQPQQFVQKVHVAQPQQFVQKVHVAQPQQFVQQAPLAQPQQFVQKVHTPLLQAGPAIIKGKQNPLTFNYGYDNGVSKVTHSYFGSGW